MIRNYLKIAIRTFQRQKFYSVLTVMGLAIGMASALLIALFIYGELRYDRFHEKANRLYRVNLDYNWNGEEGIGAATPPPVAGLLMADYPEVEAATRLYPESNTVVRYGDEAFDEDKILAVDSNFFSLFDFPLLAGDPTTALAEPNTIVLTESTANRYFGQDEPLGKTLLLWENRQVPYLVSGVVADPPAHSHIQFDMLITLEKHHVISRFSWSWIYCQFATYALLREDADVAALESKMPKMVATHGAEVMEHFISTSYEDFIASGGRWFFTFQPLTEVYLHSVDKGNLVGPLGDGKYVTIFAVVALLVLSIACINFVNLATARATQRSKEVGIRKTLGGRLAQLRGQFLTEAVLYALLSLVLALGMAELFRTLLQPLMQISIPPLSAATVGLALLMALVVGALSGAYPALYLSSFAPAKVLKGHKDKKGGSGALRQSLVVVQFAVSTLLIICTLLVYRQLGYVQNVKLGFDKENVLVINYAERLNASLPVFRQQLAAHTDILDVSLATSVPGQSYFTDFYDWEGAEEKNHMLSSLQGDYHLLSTLGMEMAEGRYFSRDFPTDTAGVILNETAVQELQLENPIGQKLTYPGASNNANREFKVLGVVKDFHMSSLHNPMMPFAIFLYHPSNYYQDNHRLVLRVAPGKAQEVLQTVEASWQQYSDGSPLAYAFLDQEYDDLFQSEQRLGRLFSLFTGMTIFIACLGLLGLVAYAVSQRTKEIGIRKVMGASAGQITRKLVFSFVKLVMIAFVLAVPAAYLLMREWLQQFAYRTTIDPGIFLQSGVIILLIAALTISWQSYKAAVADPVKSLRSE
jgi:putative ABC transport system permease protein